MAAQRRSALKPEDVDYLIQHRTHLDIDKRCLRPSLNLENPSYNHSQLDKPDSEAHFPNLVQIHEDVNPPNPRMAGSRLLRTAIPSNCTDTTLAERSGRNIRLPSSTARKACQYSQLNHKRKHSTISQDDRRNYTEPMTTNILHPSEIKDGGTSDGPWHSIFSEPAAKSPWLEIPRSASEHQAPSPLCVSPKDLTFGRKFLVANH